MLLSSLSLAALFGFQPWVIGLVIPVVGLIFVGSVAISAMYFKHRQRMQWHETARVALEKGQPLPPMTDDDDDHVIQPPAGATFEQWQAAKRAESRRHELKGGLILIGIGVALFLTLQGDVGHLAGGVLGGIGAALLLSVILDRIFSRPAAASNDGRRQP